MEITPGYNVPLKHRNKVCKLNKSLYGLKQSPRVWFWRFARSMRMSGSKQSNSDHTLFLKKCHRRLQILLFMLMTQWSPGMTHMKEKH